MGASNSKKVLDVRGAAEFLMIHPNTVWKLASQGQIGRKVGQRWRFKVEDLDRYVSNTVVSEANERGANDEQVPAGNS